MKLKNYKELFEEVDPKDWGEDDDDLYGRPHYGSKNDDYEELKKKFKEQMGESFDDDDDNEDTSASDEMDNLLYLLRTLFKNGGVEAEFESKGLDKMVYVVLNKREKMSSILKVFDLVKKLKRDILPQYDSEFEMWETKSGLPMLTFNFEYEGSDGDPNHDGTKPFDDHEGSIDFDEDIDDEDPFV